MPKIFSGRKIVKILCNDFGFFFVSQKGSHVKLRKIIRNKKITTVIPLHKELATGTLRGVLELAEVDFEEFIDRTKRV